jgi:hypothetical protein
MPRSHTTHHQGLRRRPLNCGTVPRLVPIHWHHPSTFVFSQDTLQNPLTWTSTLNLSGIKHPRTRVEPRHLHVMYRKFLLISLIYTVSLHCHRYPHATLPPSPPPPNQLRLMYAILCQDMASDQRHMHEPSPLHCYLTHAFRFRFYFFFSNLFRLFFIPRWWLLLSSRVASSLSFVCQHELVMMALQHPSAGMV